MNKINTQPTCELTKREVEVWHLIAEGLANKQIAYALFISAKTVEKHRQSVMDKLKIHNVAGLTRYAIAEGIITAVPASNPGLARGAQAAVPAETRLRQYPRRFNQMISNAFNQPLDICRMPMVNLGI